MSAFNLMGIMNYGDPFGILGAFHAMIVFFAVIAAILGLVQLLWGYKLLRFWIAVQGFVVGAGIGSLIAALVFFRSGGGAVMVIGLLLILVCAVAGAFLAYMLYKVGVFLQCFSCGYLVAMVLFGILLRSMAAASVLGIIGGIALGVLGVLFIKPMFIIATSVAGGLSCGTALGIIFGSPVAGVVLALVLIGLGLWYQITHNNGLFESSGNRTSGMKNVGAGGAMPGAGGAAGTMPGGAGTLPGAGGMMPGSAGMMPGAAGTMPGAAGTMPGTAGAMPGAAGTMPGADGTMPGTAGAMPGAAGTMPGAVGTMPGAAGTMPGAAGTMPGAGGTLPGAPGKVPGGSGLPSSMQLPPMTWRIQKVLICVGIAAAATLILGLFSSRYNRMLEPGGKMLGSILWAVIVTGAAGYVWRGNFSKESSGGILKDQLLGIAITAVPVVIVCMVLWQIYFTPVLYSIFGFSGVMLGFLFALRRALLYMVPILILGILWKQKVPSPLLYRPGKEDIYRMAVGAIVVGGAMAGMHVLSLLGTILFMHSFLSLGTKLLYLFCCLVSDVAAAAAMTYVWGRRGIYKDTEADRAAAGAASAAAGAAPAGLGAGAKASPFPGAPVANPVFPNSALPLIQTSKFRRKITAGIVKAENTHEYWREGAPLVLTQMTLAEQAGQLFLTLGLQNLGQKAVSAIYVDVDCYNVLKEKVAQLKDISFLDLKVERGNIFFNNIPMQIPDATVRHCEICLRHVVFADESIWNGAEGQFLERLELQKALAGEDGLKPELADEFCRMMAGSRKQGIADMKRLYLYTPERREGYWYCCCGQFNLAGEEICSACGIGREEMFAMLKPERLTRAREDRLEEERRRMEEEERLKAERIAERNRKIEETKAAARKKARELVSHGKNYYEKGSEKVHGYVSSLGAAKDSKAGTEAEQPVQSCPNCKAAIRPGSLFCTSCGSPLSQPEPGANQPRPEVNQPGPGVNQPEPGVNQPEPGVNQPEPEVNQPGPGMNQPEPGMNQPGPGVGQPEPGANQPEPEVNQPGPGVNQPEPGMNQPEPGVGQLEPGVDQPEPGANQPEPVVPQPEPETNQPEPEMNQPEQSTSEQKFCPNCGRENKAAAKFCIDCGARLEE